MTADSYTADPRDSSVAGARAWFAERDLTRPRSGKWVAGVAAGFARKYEWNPLVARLLAIATLLLPGPQIVAYLGLWILMPRDRDVAA